MTGRLAIVVHPDDNVATLTDSATGVTTLASGGPAAAGIPYGHKVALAAIPAGAAVVKYGIVIGRASEDIAAGAHVHVHNVSDR